MFQQIDVGDIKLICYPAERDLNNRPTIERKNIINFIFIDQSFTERTLPPDAISHPNIICQSGIANFERWSMERFSMFEAVNERRSFDLVLTEYDLHGILTIPAKDSEVIRSIIAP